MKEKRWNSWTNLNTPTHICIENTDTGQHFIRKITDVTEFEDWMIISWDAKGGKDE